MSKREKREHESGPERVSRNGTGESVKTTPFFDATLHELRVGEVLVKRFTQQSDGQEILLIAFQEEGWPQVVDDPLTGKEEQDPQQRLRRAVDNLNRRQRARLLRFRVLGLGTAVAWEFLEESDGTATLDNGRTDAIILLLFAAEFDLDSEEHSGSTSQKVAIFSHFPRGDRLFHPMRPSGRIHRLSRF